MQSRPGGRSVAPRMHALLLIDEHRLRTEREWFRRTVIGLVSNGVRVTRALPEGEPEDVRLSLAPATWYTTARVPWIARRIHDRLAAQVQNVVPDVIHSMGRGGWESAVELARRLERPVLIDIWSVDEVQAATRLERRHGIEPSYLAGSVGLFDQLVQHFPPDRVIAAPPGLHVDHPPNVVLGRPEICIAGVIAGRGSPLRSIRRLIEGLVPVTRQHPQFMLFADLDAELEEAAWRRAHELGLHAQFSMIPSVAENRSMVLDADLLFVPAATGQVTTFVLQAMAWPMITLAVRDPLVDFLNEDDWAILLPDSDPERWSRAVQYVLDHPENGQRLASRARSGVAQNHPMSRQVLLLQDCYERIVSAAALKSRLAAQGAPIAPERVATDRSPGG